MAPYCPQWFVAMGKSPARYLYYKDVNRDPQAAAKLGRDVERAPLADFAFHLDAAAVVQRAAGHRVAGDDTLGAMQRGAVKEHPEAAIGGIDDLVNATGFKPRTTLEQGIRRFFQWYTEYFEI